MSAMCHECYLCGANASRYLCVNYTDPATGEPYSRLICLKCASWVAQTYEIERAQEASRVIAIAAAAAQEDP